MCGCSKAGGGMRRVNDLLLKQNQFPHQSVHSLSSHKKKQQRQRRHSSSSIKGYDRSKTE